MILFLFRLIYSHQAEDQLDPTLIPFCSRAKKEEEEKEAQLVQIHIIVLYITSFFGILSVWHLIVPFFFFFFQEFISLFEIDLIYVMCNEASILSLFSKIF